MLSEPRDNLVDLFGVEVPLESIDSPMLSEPRDNPVDLYGVEVPLESMTHLC
jgi:hypothetical protein